MAVLLLEIALFYAIETQLPFLFGMLCFIWVSRFAGRAARFGFAKAGAANADGRNRGIARIGTEKRKRKIRAKAEALRASPVGTLLFPVLHKGRIPLFVALFSVLEIKCTLLTLSNTWTFRDFVFLAVFSIFAILSIFMLFHLVFRKMIDLTEQ